MPLPRKGTRATAPPNSLAGTLPGLPRGLRMQRTSPSQDGPHREAGKGIVGGPPGSLALQ